MDDLPVALGDALRVKGCTCNDLPSDREGRHADAVWFQIGPEHRRGRPEGRFAERDGRQGRDRMIGETAPVTMMVPRPAARMAGAATCATTMAPMTSTA
jgi:hypothetical protein